MSSSLPQFKRGSTFFLNCIHKIDGVPVSVTGKTIESEIRAANDSLITALTAVAGDQLASPGSFTLVPTNPITSAWPVGRHLCDIKITESGVIRYTDSFIVPVVDQVTE